MTETTYGSGTITATTGASANAYTVNGVLQLINKFFEPQLKPLYLSQIQIERQSLAELEQSLISVNDAISKSASFGSINLGISVEAGLFITQDQSQAHIHNIGILPVLLERKQFILQRMLTLNEDDQVDSGLEVLENDDTSKEKDEHSHKRLEILEQMAETNKESDIERDGIDDTLRRKWIQTEILEKRVGILHSLLQRESIASIVGGCLLIIIAMSLLFAMFYGVESTEIINNAFLLILGYFFGRSEIRKQNDGS